MKSTKDICNHTKQSEKKKYRVRNWKQYNESLVHRGSLIVWIPDDVEYIWYAVSGRNTYQDTAINIILTLKSLYNLPLRATEGFVQSVFGLAGLSLQVPDYTTLSRRAGTLNVTLNTVRKETVNFIADSTGGKVYGEGEWKVRKHGWCKRRTWKKIHIGIDTDGEIRAVVTTENNIHDATPIDDLLNQETQQIDGFWGDGAYDAAPVYMSLVAHDIHGIHIPPHKNAQIRFRASTTSPPYVRDENIRGIRKLGRATWKRTSGYHTRSLVENTMYRYKTAFGERISFRTKDNQHTEVMVKCNILNKFRELGRPLSYVVT